MNSDRTYLIATPTCCDRGPRASMIGTRSITPACRRGRQYLKPGGEATPSRGGLPLHFPCAEGLNSRHFLFLLVWGWWAGGASPDLQICFEPSYRRDLEVGLDYISSKDIETGMQMHEHHPSHDFGLRRRTRQVFIGRAVGGDDADEYVASAGFACSFP